MTHIRKLKLKGFKSFNKTADVEFKPGLNCIVGANGTGKTNLIDALSFGLGQLSSKTLRAENYSDLIFDRGNGGTKNGMVYFELANKDGALPVDSSVVQVARKIKKNGSTQFRLNNRNATRQQVVDLLSHAQVSPDGHNIIMQGDVSRFVDMKPRERRKIVEEIAGIQQYEERKEKALSELEKVEIKLKEAGIVLREKETYLDELFEEKKEAERFKSFSDELTRAKATKVRLRMDKINHNKNLSDKKLKEIDKKIASMHSDISKKSKTIDKHSKKIDELENKIEQHGGEERLNIQRRIEQLKVQIQTCKKTVENSKSELDRIKQRRKQLKSDAKELDRQIKAARSKTSGLESQRKQIKSQIKSLKESIGSDSENLKKLQSQLDKIDSNIEKMTDQRSKLSDELSSINSKREVMFYKIKDVEKKLEEVKSKQKQIKQIGKDKSRFRKIVSEINELTSKDSELEDELKKLQRDKTNVSEKIANLKVNSRAVEQLIKRDRAIKTITKKSKVKGVIGPVAKLGNAPSEYSRALKVAAGARLKNIVVKNENVAIRCLKELKKSKGGVATFLPLNKLRQPRKKRIPKRKGVYGLASDLIEHSKKYSGLFRYIFGNTVVVEDTSTAKKLGVGKYRIVTLDGDLFQQSGAIRGGHIRKDAGLGFQESEIKEKIKFEEKVRKNLSRKIDEREKKRVELEKQVMNLRKEKAELEGKIEAAGSLGDVSPEKYKKEKASLQKELKDIEKRKKQLESKSQELEKSIGSAKENKRKMNERIKEIQFGEKNKQIKKLEEQEHELASELATKKAQLENGLLPEKKNIKKVLKNLDKDETSFVEQAESKKKEAAKMQKELTERQKDEESYMGKLKKMFNQKSELKDKLGELNQVIESKRNEIDELEKEKNDLSVDKAKIESKLGGLKEELEQLGRPKGLKHVKSVNAARRKIRDLKGKIEDMGNVNMKALEVYEGLKKEYDDLAWKVDKLDSERKDILNVIDEIEGKKKETFMGTYDQLKENFEKLYSRMTEKGNASTLFLENKKDPFEGGVRVRVKQDSKAMNVAALSGGEKVIVALALIFAIQEFNPAPFYLLDEVDAALDSVNSEKVAELLKEYSEKAQIIIISHNDSIISAADYLYGVSMNGKGESKLVSLEL